MTAERKNPHSALKDESSAAFDGTSSRPATSPKNDPDAETATEFETLGAEQSPSFFVEFWWFLRENKRWWMAPIILALFVLMALAILTGTGAAPFIYSLF